MDMTRETCRAFIEALASDAPAPGGGGAAALVGAIGTALGEMVGSLTIGKKKYAAVEAELKTLMIQCAALREELLDQVALDEAGFLPLAKAYGISKDDPARAELLEQATLGACEAPMRMMELCGEALGAIAIFAEKGSRLAVSDAGCAAVCCKAALQSASLNVYINTKTLRNRMAAERLNARANELLQTNCALADEIFASVRANF